MRRLWMALVLVAGCGAATDQANNSIDDRAQPAGLTGLYEGPGTRPSQLCIVDKGSGEASFGLVVWGADLHSCSGAGSAVREGNRLTLAMAGDRSCTIEAVMEGGKVTLPAEAPEGCSYYCGAKAKLGGAAFTKKGGTMADAAKAVDLVGEPLCIGPIAPTP